MKKKLRGLLNLKAVIILFILDSSLNSIAQNTSYDANTVGILGAYNCAFGIQSLYSNTSTGWYNVAVGYRSLYSNTTGLNNSAVGYVSLYSNTTGSSNSALGYNALYYNSSGSANSAFGTNTLVFNTTGTSNSAFGNSALVANTTGSSNCAIGESALQNNTTGILNTGVGNSALASNSIGNYNAAFGFGALASNSSGNYNTALGYLANVGSNNLTNATAIGSGAIVNNSNSIQLGNSSVTSIYSGVGTNAKLITGGLQVTGGTILSGYVLTSDFLGNATWQPPSGGGSAWSLIGNAGTVDGTNFIGTTDNVPLNIRVNNIPSGRIDPTIFNTCFGYGTLANNITGQVNTAIGHLAMQNNISGVSNTAIGPWALVNNLDGNHNVAMGLDAMLTNTIGSGNTGVGNSALFYNKTGKYNSALGYAAYLDNETGNYNSALGAFANVGLNSLTNTSAVGALSIVNASNKIRFGDVTVTVVEGPVAYTISDGRFKENISEEDVKGLDFINRLRPVVYNFNTRNFEEFLTQNMPDSIKHSYFDGKDFETSTAIRQSGFIAQEVEKAASESGYNFNGLHIPDSKFDNYSLSYGQFVVPLVKAVQELSNQNQRMQKTIAEQKSINETLKNEIDELKTMVKNDISESKTGSIKIAGETSVAKLFQNAPNPFNKSTIIRYSIPSDAARAIIAITTLDGIKVSEFNLVNNKGRGIEITGGSLSEGTYIYSLFVDNKLIDSKKMILTR